MIDSHCHLADKQFAQDRDAVVRRAEERGVNIMVCIADDVKEGEKCLDLAEKYEQLCCTIGVHPHQAKHGQDSDGQKIEVMLASSPKAVAVGEIGLDYHYDNSPRETQQRVFR